MTSSLSSEGFQLDLQNQCISLYIRFLICKYWLSDIFCWLCVMMLDFRRGWTPTLSSERKNKRQLTGYNKPHFALLTSIARIWCCSILLARHDCMGCSQSECWNGGVGSLLPPNYYKELALCWELRRLNCYQCRKITHVLFMKIKLIQWQPRFCRCCLHIAFTICTVFFWHYLASQEWPLLHKRSVVQCYIANVMLHM